MNKHFFKRLIIFFSIIAVGVISLFYLDNLFSSKKIETSFEPPHWFVYPQDFREDSEPLVIILTPPEKVQTAVKETKKEISPKKTANKYYTQEDIVTISKLVYGEGRGLNKTEMSAIVWCVLNRVDSKIFPNTIYEVCTQKGQFHGYKAHHPVWDNIAELVEDVLKRWVNEKNGSKNVGRTLPSTYLFFVGDGKHNHYMEVWKSGKYYQWTLKSPYKD